VAGFSRERRTFLSLQMEANKTRTLEELWAHVGEALEMLKFDRAELHLNNRRTAPLFPPGSSAENRDRASFSCGKKGSVPGFPGASTASSPLENASSVSFPRKPESIEHMETPDSRFHGKENVEGEGENRERRRPSGNDSPRPTSTKIFLNVCKHADETVRIWTRGYYRRESDERRPEGMLKIDLPLDSNGAHLLLVKDINRDPLNYYTLRRLEHLRRTLLSNLARLREG